MKTHPHIIVLTFLSLITPFCSSEANKDSQQHENYFKVAAVQAVSEMAKPEKNSKHLENLVRKAAQQGAKVIVLPETAITGYMTWDIKTTWQVRSWPTTRGLKGTSCEKVAENTNGTSVKTFTELSDELDIYLTVPFLEFDPNDGRYYNTVILAGPEGNVLAHYRKINPWPWAEKSWASNGNLDNIYVDTPYGRMSLLICYDINFEPPNLKKLGIDHLLYPIAWVDSPESKWFDVNLPAIAKENNLNIIGANWTVPDSYKPNWHGYGKTRIIDNKGTILAKASKDIGEEIVYATLPIPVKTETVKSETNQTQKPADPVHNN